MGSTRLVKQIGDIFSIEFERGGKKEIKEFKGKEKALKATRDFAKSFKNFY
ncbi:MAG: hypothetical protein Q8O88_00825 [bacterium]|nr:hypothetical protein [bacterium]